MPFFGSFGSYQNLEPRNRELFPVEKTARERLYKFKFLYMNGESLYCVKIALLSNYIIEFKV